jgi:hypothetical protein
MLCLIKYFQHTNQNSFKYGITQLIFAKRYKIHIDDVLQVHIKIYIRKQYTGKIILHLIGVKNKDL